MKAFGVRIEDQIKTEKNVEELNIDINLNLELSKVIEEGKVLKNVYGSGFTGLSNLGNSCYMNSIIQIIFSLEPFKERFFDTALQHLKICSSNSLECYECQMAKIFFGLHSGLYSEKKERKLLNKEGKKEDIEEYQLGIRPKSFKNFFNKNHEEFSSNRQQDAFEYLNFLLEKIDKEEIKRNRRSLLKFFEFDTETKLICTECHGFKINKTRNNSLIFNIPKWKEKETNKEGCLFEECMHSWLSTDQVELDCSVCKKKTNYLRKQRMVDFPHYLIILYQRFVYDWVPYKLDIDLHINYNSINFKALNYDFMKIEGEFEIPKDKEDEKEEEVEPEFKQESLNYLLDMGIPELGAKHALLNNNQDQNLALDWYFNNSSDPSLFEPIPRIKKVGKKEDSPKVDLSLVNQLIDFGFNKDQAEGALLKFNNNIEQASDFLFSNPDFVYVKEECAKKEEEETINDGNSCILSLMAFVTHLGKNTSSGHYVCNIKNEEKWYYYNDEKVCETNDPSIGKGYVYIFKNDGHM